VEKILVEDIPVIISKIKRNYLIDKWFFIRYVDPDFHLRIRFLLKNKENTGQIIGTVNDRLSKLIKCGLVWKMQLDTYNRELERYGKHLIEEAESVFYTDSECVLSIIKKLNGNENYRWMIALKLINELLSDFGLNMEEKQKLMENLNKSFKAEFGFNEYNSKQFNSKFRENKKLVESVLNNTLNENAFIPLLQPIKKRTKALMSVITQIKNKSGKDEKVNELLKSYLHMTLNRLFRSRNRQHEMVLYDFMFRYYTSELAKQKYNNIIK
jgi:thiopeptide-type bacteriocin biosynthesis protein